MNMEEQLLPIVRKGKYAGKPITELLNDEWYVENFLKKEENKKWFNPQNSHWAPIYKIVFHQTMSTNKDSKTPEHNKLQNLFLVKTNQYKLVSKVFDIIRLPDGLFADEDIIRCFGRNLMHELSNNLNETIIKFEDKNNWDMVFYYKDAQYFKLTTQLET